MESWKIQLGSQIVDANASGVRDVIVKVTDGADRDIVMELIASHISGTMYYAGVTGAKKMGKANQIKYMLSASGGQEEFCKKILAVKDEAEAYAAASANQATKGVEKETTDTGSTNSGSSIDLTTIIIIVLAAFIIVYFFKD